MTVGSDRQFYAHSLPDRPESEWEPLEDHLRNVARLAEQFADKFHAGPWGRVAGLWHDLGKYSQDFQGYLRAANGIDAHLEQFTGKIDHSTAGAQYAASTYPGLGDVLAYALAGHHAGLCDRTAVADASGLDARLKKAVPDWSAAPEHLQKVIELPVPSLSVDAKDPARGAFQIALFGRMLFSCLVDADFLATEAFMSRERSQQRPTSANSIRQLRECLDHHLDALAQHSRESEVNIIRREVLEACRSAAARPRGLFSLSVPTGGGKTLASLAFGLAHAEQHGMDRVICVIPFTSIIEQTADIYRRIFDSLGAETVLEHHSSLDPDRETPQSRLAAENWDAPIVVTTNVQLFESLFAAKTSRCRKLHRLVNSVIVLDEVQTLPVKYLRPCLAVLKELVADYGCTVVLCTATQPALEFRKDFPIGLHHVRGIIPDSGTLHHRMKRVKIAFLGKQSDDELVEILTWQQCFLCIVNTRPHAARLYEQLTRAVAGDPRIFHLSTFMCGAHRSDVLTAIRALLSKGKPCRVISTQLIEAGVDVDFPLVYRALTGIDSIAQAAGRCNREGRLREGIVYVFEPSNVRLQGYLRSVAESAAEVLEDTGDLLSPETVRRYFELHYWKQSGGNRWDDSRIMDCFPTPPHKLQFQYKTAANSFQFIESAGKPVLVPYGTTGRQLIERLRAIGPCRDLLRKLQRYTVAVFEHSYDSMLGTDIELLDSGHAVLLNAECYDARLGFRARQAGQHEPETLIC